MVEGMRSGCMRWALTQPMRICPSHSNTSSRQACCAISRLARPACDKRAVTRNTIKRQIYAFAEHQRWSQPASERVVRLRKAFDSRVFTSATSAALKTAVRLELQQLFDKAEITT